MSQLNYIHEVCARVGGRTLPHNQISRMDSLPNFVTRGAPLCALRARKSSAIINYYRFPPWPVLEALNAYRLCSTLI